MQNSDIYIIGKGYTENILQSLGEIEMRPIDLCYGKKKGNLTLSEITNEYLFPQIQPGKCFLKCWMFIFILRQ